MQESDLPDYMATGVRQHVRNAKDAQLKNGGSPILTTIEQIKGFIRSSLRGETTGTIKGYGKVGSRMAQDISDSSDGRTDVRGYYLELDGNRIRHMKDHVDTDSDGRNIPLTSAQAEQLTEYIDNYDEVLDVLTRKDGSTKVYLSKDTGDGHVVIVELVSKGRRSLQPVTAWQNTYEAFENIWGKKKRADSASQAEQNLGSSGYQPTLTETSSRPGSPQSGITGDVSGISIPTAPQNVKQNFEGEGNYRSNLGKGNGTRTTQTVETISDADITTDERREQLNPYIQNGRFDYIPDTNKAQVERATRKIMRNGWRESVQDFHDAVIKGKSGKDLVAQGAVLLNNASNSDATGTEYLDLANDYIELLHRAGETLQAGKILQQLTPEGRLYCMQKTVKLVNQKLTKGQHKAIAKAQEGKNYKNANINETYEDYGVKLDESLADEYMRATTDEQRDAVVAKIQQNIADQIPSTFVDKWNALRYVNMLGNFKTQVRNVGGNALMLATTATKNRVKAAAEVTANLFRTEDNQIERTASFVVGGKLRKEANCTPFVIQYDILSNKWGVVHYLSADLFCMLI